MTGSAAPSSEVSVGSSTNLRRITNVADGSAANDAVTVAQLSTGMSTTTSAIASLSTSTSTGLSPGCRPRIAPSLRCPRRLRPA
ncbi:hypothetical protein [Burkholderia pseudomallei]|uniref:hypothetical protein n=1 Tax=Burkholderia pseudomallei TaxID=28450 RepID=UPI002E111D07